MDIVFVNTSDSNMLQYNTNLGYNDFIVNHFVPFLKCTGIGEKLDHIRLQYGGHQPFYDQRENQWLSFKRLSCLHNSMFESELELTPPRGRLPSSSQSAEDPSPYELTLLLCRLLTDREVNKLMSIVSNGVQIPSKEQTFLIFMFGYNNKMLYKDKNYRFLFSQ